jgi:symplekin
VFRAQRNKAPHCLCSELHCLSNPFTATTAAMNPSAQTLGQLESARSLALGDGRYYPTIIPGVLPIIGANANATLEVRRWGADFLAETFASPTWPPDAKASCALSVLATLKEYLEVVDDSSVIRSAVQAAASIYPLVYRHM